MYGLLLFISILIGIIGLLMVISPGLVSRMNRLGNKVIISDTKILEHRFASGGISLAFGLFFIYMAMNYNPVSAGILILPFLILGSVLGIIGLLFLISPKFFEVINSWSSKEMVSEKSLTKYPRFTGAFFIVAALLFYYTASYFK